MLPAEIRQQDGIEAGQEFEVERLDRGSYRLVRRQAGDGAAAVEEKLLEIRASDASEILLFDQA